MGPSNTEIEMSSVQPAAATSSTAARTRAISCVNVCLSATITSVAPIANAATSAPSSTR